MYKPTDRARVGQTDLQVTPVGLSAPRRSATCFGKWRRKTLRAPLKPLSTPVCVMWTRPLFYGYGLAENRVGRALSGKNRDDFVVSTKVGRLIRPGKRTGTEVYGRRTSLFYLANPEMCCVLDYGYDGIMRSHEDSLKTAWVLTGLISCISMIPTIISNGRSTARTRRSIICAARAPSRRSAPV